jgi:hypothetical protein
MLVRMPAAAAGHVRCGTSAEAPAVNLCQCLLPFAPAAAAAAAAECCAAYALKRPYARQLV